MRWFLGNPRPGGVNSLDLNAIYQGPAMYADPVSGSYMLDDGAQGQTRYRRAPSTAQDVALADYSTFTRAGIGATDFNKAGALVEYAADTIRYGYSGGAPQGIMLEGTMTNMIQNPRAEGAVIGSPGTNPIRWGQANALNGIVISVEATGTENGLSYIDYRFAGTVAGANFQTNIFPELNHTIAPAVSGQTWTSSAYMKMVQGDTTAFNFAYLYIVELEVAGGLLTQSQFDTKAALTSTLTRFSITRTFNQATTAYARHNIYFQAPIGAVLDHIVRIAGPQLEQNYYASSLILPPVAAPAAQTRNFDLFQIIGSDFTDIFGVGAPTGHIITEVSAVKTPATISQQFAVVSDGTSANRIDLRTSSAGNILIQVLQSSVTIYTSPTVVAFPADQSPIRCGITWDRNEIVVYATGGVFQRTTSLGIAFAEARLGRNMSGASPMNGRVRRAIMGSAKLSDAQLQAMCVVGA